MNLQVGVKVFLRNDDGAYLMLRRAKAFEHGGQQVWDIPGGRIKPNEKLLNALKREVTEETDLVLTADPKLLAAQDIFVPSKDLHVVRLTYQAVARGSITLSDEHDEFKWMTISELVTIDTLDPYLLEVLKREEA